MIAQGNISKIYQALGEYWDHTQDPQRGIDVGATIVPQLEAYPEAERTRMAGAMLMRVLSDIGRRQNIPKHFEAAEQVYQTSLAVTQSLTGFDDKQRALWSAVKYHQRGRVAQEQRQWGQAGQYYQQALQIKIEYNDRYQQAGTYHQLGIVAQEQRQWPQAREYFLKDLEITAAFDDNYGLGITLRSLARLWQASGDNSLPAAIAALIGGSATEAEQRLR